MSDDPKIPKLDQFERVAESLKLYRRAELRNDAGDELIEKLYVDPLPNEHILRTMLKPHTTFLVGRKGTGKSTIFQRAQFELRKSDQSASAYVDIKSVYESSRVDAEALAAAAGYEGVLSGPSLERLWLNRDFFVAVISSIREELEKKIQASTVWSRLVKRSSFVTTSNLFLDLDELIAEAREAQFENVLGAVSTRVRVEHTAASENQSGIRLGVEPDATLPSLSIEARGGSSTVDVDEAEQVEVLLRVFNLRKMIEQLRTVLHSCGVHSLYVFIDDFSELPEPAMRTVVDALLAPLNNWSDELIKFKIAAYPGRVHYGAIDPTKIDEINLDLYSLYGTSDLVVMEQKAVDFTRRLVVRRLEHFGASPFAVYFEGVEEELWRQLFSASMANPRTLGYLLYFAHEASLIYGRRIGSGTVRDVARRYFEDKIQAAFDLNRFLNESFSERSSIFSLKELLETVVDKARGLRNSDAAVFRDIDGRVPTSHFHVDLQMEGLLSSLELSFFVTRYYTMSDRDGRKVAVYALNYGLCQARNIEFGRPSGTRDRRYRQYFAERVFDYTPLMVSYLNSHQEIVCDTCGGKHNLEDLPAIRTFGMMCPSCKSGRCAVINLSRKYETMLQEVSDSSLLPQVDLGILHTLATESAPLGASDVAGELDCSYQLVGKRVKNLDERGLVDRSQWDGPRRRYAATDLARSIYFPGEASEDGSRNELSPQSTDRMTEEDWDF